MKLHGSEDSRGNLRLSHFEYLITYPPHRTLP